MARIVKVSPDNERLNKPIEVKVEINRKKPYIEARALKLGLYNSGGYNN